jgi:hypothetical protein
VTPPWTLPAAVRDVVIGALAVVFVASPALFTSWGFGPDFTNHLWLVSQQSEAIAHLGHPTLFMQSDSGGIFQPFYGFYGGSLYALTGGLSALLGQHPEIAYVASIVLFAAMAYRGVWLLGRLAGLSRLLAHVPAYVFLTSAYFLTDLYARGAWPEFAALAALPFVVAYGVRLLRGGWTAGAVLAFAWGCVLLSGSHNITLMWSTILLVIGGGVAWAVLGSDRPSLLQIGKVAAVALLAVGVNFWFLLLDLRHGNDTMIAHSPFSWHFTKQFDTPKAILTPLRTAPEAGTFNLVVAAPVFALVVALGLLAVRRRSVLAQPQTLRRLWLVCGGLLVLVLGLMMMPGSWWTTLGSPFTLIQFPYRLAGYVAFVISILLALSLRLAVGSAPSKPTAFVLVLLLGVTTIQAGVQMWARTDPARPGPATTRDRSLALANGPTKPPNTWYDGGAYRDSSRRVLDIDLARAVVLPVPRPGAKSVTATVELPEGDAPVFTNIAGGPYVVRISGVGVAGRAKDGRTAIVRLPGQSQRVTITVAAAGGKPQTAAGAISILSLLALLGIAAAVEVRRRRPGPDSDPLAPSDDNDAAPTMRVAATA